MERISIRQIVVVLFIASAVGISLFPLLPGCGASGTQYQLTVQVTGSGSVVPAGGTYPQGTVVLLNPTPATGWMFDHWEGDLDGNDEPGEITMYSDATVIAVFVQAPTRYELLTNTQGQGTITVEPDRSEYDPDTVVTLTADPADDWQFDHWEGDLTGSANPAAITMNANKTVTAVFTEVPGDQYTLTVLIQGQGSVDLLPQGGIYDYGETVTLTPNPSTGWSFDHWEGDLTGSVTPGSLFMSEDKTVTAVFTQVPSGQYTLTILIQGQGSVDLLPQGGTYDDGQTVTLTPNPSTGWSFDHWEGDLTGSANPATITMNADKTVTAVFTQIAGVQHTLTVLIQGQGSVDLQPPGGTYDDGQTVTLTANPATGWNFDHWEGDLTGSANPATITMNADKTVTAVFVAETTPTPSEFTVTAVYDWIADDDNLSDSIALATLSGDGATVAFVNGRSGTGRKVYTIDASGENLTSYAIPDGTGGVTSIAISGDGSRVFLAAPYEGAIYKLESGAITTIDVSPPGGDPAAAYTILATSDGEWVYFPNWTGSACASVWRVSQDGATLEKVFDTASVPRDLGTSFGLDHLAISDDGSAMAFTIWGYVDTSGTWERQEVFSRVGETFHQLTTDGNTKGYLTISGDGSKIVFAVWGSENTYYSIDADGGGKTALETTGYNFGGMALTTDGSKWFYSDGNANGGRKVQTDGSGVLDLMPHWNINNIAIGVTDCLCASDDGCHIMFKYEYASWPFKNSIYVGHLNDPDAVPDAPVFESIAFSPAAMPTGDPNASVMLFATISDPDGLTDVTNAAVDEMLEGRLETINANLPAYFYFDPHDDGSAPDVTAGDGIFTTSGSPGGKINELTEVTIRVSAKDSTKTVIVADTILPIGP